MQNEKQNLERLDPTLAQVVELPAHDPLSPEALEELRTAGAFDRWVGRRVAIPAPSYQFLTRTGDINVKRRELALTNFRRFGLEPVLLPTVFEQEGRFAGTDRERAEDLMRAMTMRTIDLVMPIRGGYGMTRLLPLLDWDRLGEAATPVIGYSDFTALNLALLAKTGRPSWQGPMLGSFDRPDRYAMTRFGVVFGDAPGPVTFTPGPVPALPSYLPPLTIEGTLWGGNLALVSSLAGSEWMPEIEGGILFLEDVDEAAYRVERMLLTLLDAGVLGRQRAVILGDFAGANEAWRFPGDMTLARVFAYIRSRLPATVFMLSGLPFGHVPHQATLPVGVSARLSIAYGRAALDWARDPRLIVGGSEALDAQPDAQDEVAATKS